MFQFLNGTIKIKQIDALYKMQAMFQFLNGTIKIGLGGSVTGTPTSFNSSMVRLK